MTTLAEVRERADYDKKHGITPPSATRDREFVLSQLDALQAECEGLKADALRYRWLRDRVFKDGGNLAIEVAGAYDNYVGGSMADGLERAIDAEIVK